MIIAVVGPTGTGKTDLSLDLAERLVGDGRAVEIINADAMQLYRGMDIGTAKVPQSDRRGIPHHLLDVLEPRDEASVARYQAEARAVVEQILGREGIPLIVGGSGLYVSSVLYGYEFPGTDPAIRHRLEAELEASGPGTLHRRLTALDAPAAEAVGPFNGRRIVRALEVIELTGRPFSAGLPSEARQWRPSLTVGLELDRNRLVDRLDARARRMWSDGLLDEVTRLRPAGFGATAARAIGYAQAIAQLDGELDESAAVEQTSALTRRYARRQVSWFRRYAKTHWISADDPARVDDARSIVDAALAMAESGGGGR